MYINFKIEEDFYVSPISSCRELVNNENEEEWEANQNENRQLNLKDSTMDIEPKKKKVKPKSEALFFTWGDEVMDVVITEWEYHPILYNTLHHHYHLNEKCKSD